MIKRDLAFTTFKTSQINTKFLSKERHNAQLGFDKNEKKRRGKSV